MLQKRWQWDHNFISIKLKEKGDVNEETILSNVSAKVY